jgi:hypothetical protein
MSPLKASKLIRTGVRDSAAGQLGNRRRRQRRAETGYRLGCALGPSTG